MLGIGIEEDHTPSISDLVGPPVVDVSRCVESDT
jgi:hypothetical protein